METVVRPKNKSVNVRMPPELKARIKELAGKKHWSVNYYIVRALTELTKPR